MDIWVLWPGFFFNDLRTLAEALKVLFALWFALSHQLFNYLSCSCALIVGKDNPFPILGFRKDLSDEWFYIFWGDWKCYKTLCFIRHHLFWNFISQNYKLGSKLGLVYKRTWSAGQSLYCLLLLFQIKLFLMMADYTFYGSHYTELRWRVLSSLWFHFINLRN